MTKAQLQAAYDALKAENDALRAHVCPSPVTIHKFPPQTAAGAGVPLVLNTASGVYQTFDGSLTVGAGVCAGAAPLHTIQMNWVTT